MEFRKYQHIERFGTSEVEGIEYGKCYIFPKIDGSNGSTYLGNDGLIHAGSRNRELTLDKDNGGFFAYILTLDNVKQCLLDNPNLRLFGKVLFEYEKEDNNIKDKWCRIRVYSEDGFCELSSAVVHYVHQLQHALRLAGIEKEIEV